VPSGIVTNCNFWIPACAGMTEKKHFLSFYGTINLAPSSVLADGNFFMAEKGE
jgi:hypothetical protein